MNIYKISFIHVEDTGFGDTKKTWVTNKDNKEDKIYISNEFKALFVPATDVSDLGKYQVYGRGIEGISRVAELADGYFSPVIPEADFVENEIRSKKNGTILGHQG